VNHETQKPETHYQLTADFFAWALRFNAWQKKQPRSHALNQLEMHVGYTGSYLRQLGIDAPREKDQL
jgi:hypothetical protein